MPRGVPRKLSNDELSSIAVLFDTGWAYRAISKVFSISEYRLVKTVHALKLNFPAHTRARYEHQHKDYARAHKRQIDHPDETFWKAYRYSKINSELGLDIHFNPIRKRAKELLKRLRKRGSP